MHSTYFDALQSAILNDLAEGKSHYEIGSQRGLNQAELNSELLDMQARLGAKTPAHLIHKAWTVGLFSAKHLCLVLLVATCAQLSDHSSLRPKANRRAPTARIVTTKLKSYT
jgi:DNA-binding CsgD family transcriptional regulator